MNTKQRTVAIVVLLLSLAILSCSVGQSPSPTPAAALVNRPTAAPTLIPTTAPTLPPTSTPTLAPTATSTPVPSLLSQTNLSEIALQASDLTSDFQLTENTTSAAGENVINFYSVSFAVSTQGMSNTIRVFETAALASEYFQNDTKDVDPGSQIEIPSLGDEAVGSQFDLLSIKMIMISWRCETAAVFLEYSSQDGDGQLMAQELILLAQQIDARLKATIAEASATN